MTREEEISKAAYSQYCNSESIYFTLMCDSFKQGAEWADSNPKNVWHNASEEPEIGSNIVAIDKLGQLWIIQPYDGDYNGCRLKGWRCCVHNYNDIQKWAYISDLLPKGGKK